MNYVENIRKSAFCYKKIPHTPYFWAFLVKKTVKHKEFILYENPTSASYQTIIYMYF